MNRPSRNRFLPRFESLEDRTTPTCTITQQGGTLLITGSAGRDLVQIGEDGLGSVNVRCDQERAPRLFNGISRIQVRTLGGSDTVRYDLFNNVLNARSLDVDLGAGNDRFDSFLNDKDVLGQGRLNLQVRGRAGNDRINCDTTRDGEQEVVTALSARLNTSAFGSLTFGAVGLGALTLNGNPGTDIGQSASLTCRISGDAGSDNITMNHTGNVQGALTIDVTGETAPDVINLTYAGVVQGTLNVTANGNGGSDRIVVNITLNSGSNGRVRARVLGEGGADNLTLNIRTPPPTPAPQVGVLTVDGQINGGDGTDTCQSLGNVLRISCP